MLSLERVRELRKHRAAAHASVTTKEWQALLEAAETVARLEAMQGIRIVRMVGSEAFTIVADIEECQTSTLLAAVRAAHEAFSDNP